MYKKIKYFTLKNNRSYQYVYNKGEFLISPLIVIYILKNRNLGLRVGFTASKKVGKACKRNRAKRLMKESFYQILKENSNMIYKNYDIIFVARAKTHTVKMKDVKKTMFFFLKRFGVFFV